MHVISPLFRISGNKPNSFVLIEEYVYSVSLISLSKALRSLNVVVVDLYEDENIEFLV